MKREQQCDQLRSEKYFDVVILGGGINGACLYDNLCSKGYRVLLVDKNDFGSGTSQASGMMIWGGLLYLRNFDLSTVFQLSHDRDYLIQDKAEWLSPQMMRYLSSPSGRSKWWVYSALWFYWFMAKGRRRVPRSEKLFSESPLIKPELVTNSLVYEEAFLDHSDARFVYRWIAPHQRHSGQVALNYCDTQGAYSSLDKRWHLNIQDTLDDKNYEVETSLIVNCAGIWTDQVNQNFKIDSPFRHAFSKGVYLGLAREEQHESSLFFDLGEHDDVITYVPWGPISLWGPTETPVDTISEGIQATTEDIHFLLEQYERRFLKPISKHDIISIRCGVRPLVVNRDYQGNCYPLDLSRRQEIIQDACRPWISCYGGKLTGCTRMADRVLKLVKKVVLPSGGISIHNINNNVDIEKINFPELTQPVISPTWCVENELCCSLDDYLRRRTNIAQWIPRGGLGVNDANAEILKNISLQIANGDIKRSDQLFENYRTYISNNFDSLINE